MCNVFSTVVLFGDTVNKQTNIARKYNINYKESQMMGGCSVGYLHNTVEELNSGLPRTNPDCSRMEDLNEDPPDFKRL